jgi:hypothetical protein
MVALALITAGYDATDDASAGTTPMPSKSAPKPTLWTPAMRLMCSMCATMVSMVALPVQPIAGLGSHLLGPSDAAQACKSWH